MILVDKLIHSTKYSSFDTVVYVVYVTWKKDLFLKVFSNIFTM